MRGLKQDDLKKHSTCSSCYKMIGQIKPLPIFWIVKAERHGLDIQAVNRHSGLEDMLGNALLARHMGSNEDMTMSFGGSEFMICDTCMIEKMPQALDEKFSIKENEDG